MTEAEWLASTDPQVMLEAIRNGRLSSEGRHVGWPLESGRYDRKLRLFACGLWRLHHILNKSEQMMQHKGNRGYIEAAEAMADGVPLSEKYRCVEGYRWCCHLDNPFDAARTTLEWWQSFHYENPPDKAAALLRDIFGNPWRPVIRSGIPFLVAMPADPTKGSVLEEEWLRWNDGTVPKIAQAIFDERRFDEMPILADAMEEAGCDNEEILRHCRGEELYLVMERPKVNLWGWRLLRGPHVRGCWVLDLLLGKE